jgi:hypothetical protein
MAGPCLIDVRGAAPAKLPTPLHACVRTVLRDLTATLSLAGGAGLTSSGFEFAGSKQRERKGVRDLGQNKHPSPIARPMATRFGRTLAGGRRRDGEQKQLACGMRARAPGTAGAPRPRARSGVFRARAVAAARQEGNVRQRRGWRRRKKGAAPRGGSGGGGGPGAPPRPHGQARALASPGRRTPWGPRAALRSARNELAVLAARRCRVVARRRRARGRVLRRRVRTAAVALLHVAPPAAAAARQAATALGQHAVEVDQKRGAEEGAPDLARGRGPGANGVRGGRRGVRRTVLLRRRGQQARGRPRPSLTQHSSTTQRRHSACGSPAMSGCCV